MKRIWKVILTALTLLSVLAGFMTAPQNAAAQQPVNPSSDGLWSDFDEASLQAAGARWNISASSYRTVAASSALQAALLRAPLEGSADAASPLVISLPTPDGDYLRLAVIEAPIMAPELAARYPQIKTYIAWDPANAAVHGRLDWAGALGFHGMLYTPEGIFFIDPYRRDDTTHYLSYYRKDAVREAGTFIETLPLGDNAQVQEILGQPGFQAATGPQLRTYRTVVAATAEYSNYFGGTRELGQAAIVVSMNRINGIYESEVAVRMTLVGNNDQVVYFGDTSKDPYDNNDGGLMLEQNQLTVDSVIGSANYDVGHVYSTGGGGVAYLGVPCENGWKAKGVTGSPVPDGDAYWVDYVAHEMGHQFGANHTFNSVAGSCGGGNRNAGTAYEPGSGTTIMSYAGICGADDIQPHSDAFFHGASFDEIVAYTQSGYGNTCAAITATGNLTPTANAGTDYSIPKSTPFTLTGSGSDPDDEPLTYCWEGFDKANPGGPPNNPSRPPFFRNFNPTSEPTRTFPQISDIVNNVNTKGEILPGVAYLMHFRLTARDNHVSPSAGGVAYDSMTVNVVNVGPFTVTAPNTAVTWQVGAQETVSWNVGGTTDAPISCANVDISLSVDGGYTYPVSILAGTANDGSETVTVPDNLTSTARVKVACSNNIFFDISNTNFTIEPVVPTAVLGITKSVDPAGSVTPGTSLAYTIEVTNTGSLAAVATTTDTFPLGLVNPLCESVPGNLNVQEALPIGATLTYGCTADVDGALSLVLTAGVDHEAVYYGDTVNVTLTATNPLAAATLTGVTVSDPDLTTCTPALGVPFDLAPGASQVFTCPVEITQDFNSTVNAAADFLISNIAQVSAPEADESPVSSLPAETTVTLSAQDDFSVTLLSRYIYLPLMLR